jgi:N-acetylneuraminic acid mutarotase
MKTQVLEITAANFYKKKYIISVAVNVRSLVFSLCYSLLLLANIKVAAQNVGIGVPAPLQKLEVSGAIKIGTSITGNDGTIRYQSGAFEGYNGGAWKTFTQLPAGTLVASATNPNTALTNAGFSFFTPVYVNKTTTITTTADTWLAVQDFNAPEARSSHTAIWTGSKMIVWGGYSGSDFINSGGMYDPLTDAWSAVSTAPLSGRFLHTAVWTGTHMIIWGGSGAAGLLNDGAAYNPATDSWTLLNSVNAPLARNLHTAIWTGTEMIIWGGQISGTKTNTGSKYNFATSTWTALPTALGPSARFFHTALWTGSKMLIWGGEDIAGLRKNDGAVYNNATNTWDGPTATVSAPVARYRHTAIWTGTEMVIWGGTDPGSGYFNSGGKYNPSTNTWTSATNLSGAPANRAGHAAIWTGNRMIIWGGNVAGTPGNELTNTGGKYDPATNTWASVGLLQTPADRTDHTAVWTGNQMIIYGGYGESGSMPINNGRYIINSESNIGALVLSALYLFSKN